MAGGGVPTTFLACDCGKLGNENILHFTFVATIFRADRWSSMRRRSVYSDFLWANPTKGNKVTVIRFLAETPSTLRDVRHREQGEPSGGVATKQAAANTADQEPFECSSTDRELSDHQLQALWGAYPEWDSLEIVDPS